MNRVAFGCESGFVNDFRHRWVSMDRSVDILGCELLVKGEAHFRDEFSGIFSDDVST